jgi:di/tricarboxylate transporter
MVLFGVLTIPQSYKGIDGKTCILVGGMIPLATAMTQTGAAERIAETLVTVVGNAGPLALLAGLFLVTDAIT